MGPFVVRVALDRPDVFDACPPIIAGRAIKIGEHEMDVRIVPAPFDGRLERFDGFAVAPCLRIESSELNQGVDISWIDVNRPPRRGDRVVGSTEPIVNARTMMVQVGVFRVVFERPLQRGGQHGEDPRVHLRIRKTQKGLDEIRLLNDQLAQRLDGRVVGRRFFRRKRIDGCRNSRVFCVKAVFKDFNSSGESLVRRLRTFRKHGVHVLGSFIFGLSTDRPDTFDATVALAEEAEVTVAQFVLMTPFPGTVDFQRWEKKMENDPTRIAGFPLTRYWLIPQALRPKMYMPHPTMSGPEILQRTQKVWDTFYRLSSVWRRSRCLKSLRNRLAFVLMSKIYRQMYANTGIATDSARVNRAALWTRWLAKPCQRLFKGKPMPELKMPPGVSEKPIELGGRPLVQLGTSAESSQNHSA